MKKRVLISVMMTALLVITMAAASFAVSIAGPETVKPGDTVILTVTGDEQGTSGKVSVNGLRIDSVTGGFSTIHDFLVVGSYSGLTATYNCVVTAQAGETVSFTVDHVVVSDGEKDSDGASATWTAAVVGAAPATETPAPTQTPTPSPSDDNAGVTVSQTPAPTASASVSAPAATVTASATRVAGKADDVPKTSDASINLWMLGLLAAVLAGVAVVAGRKAFGHR